jgi:hypothetical protein
MTVCPWFCFWAHFYENADPWLQSPSLLEGGSQIRRFGPNTERAVFDGAFPAAQELAGAVHHK